MKATTPFLALLLAAGTVSAQDAKLTQAQGRGDVAQLVSLLESTHPDPYSAFGGKVAFKRAAQALAAAVPDSGTTRAALDDLLRPFLVRLRDGHTYINGMSERWRDPSPRLALRFGVAADGVFLGAHDVASLDGVLGWKVIAVNGVPLDTLMARYDAFALENAYARYTGATGILRSAKPLHNVLRADTMVLRFFLESPEGRVEQREVSWSARAASASTDAWRQPPVQWSERRRTTEILESAVLPGAAAGYLRIGQLMTREAFELSWQMSPENTSAQVSRWYQSRGRELPADPRAAIAAMPSLLDTTTALLRTMQEQHIKTLIIDLRDDDGGFTPSAYPMLYALYGDAFANTAWPGEYVQVESPLYLEKFGTTLEEKRKGDPAFEFGRYVFSRDTLASDPAARRRTQIEEWRKAGYSWAEPLARLDGRPVYRPERVIVLCNHGTYSAAFHVMMLLRQLGATVVGVPSRQSPNTFMEVTPFTLSASGLQGSISNSAQIMLPEDPQADVLQPDFPVTLEVFRRYGMDQEAVLRYALELLRAGKIAAR